MDIPAVDPVAQNSKKAICAKLGQYSYKNVSRPGFDGCDRDTVLCPGKQSLEN